MLKVRSSSSYALKSDGHRPGRLAEIAQKLQTCPHPGVELGQPQHPALQPGGVGQAGDGLIRRVELVLLDRS